MKTITTKMKNIQNIASRYVTKFRQHLINWKRNRDVDEFLYELSKTVSEKEYPIYEKLVRNSVVAHLANQEANSNQTGALTLPIYLNLVVKTLAKIIDIRHVIGIQPLMGPVGLSYSLEYTSSKDEDKDLKSMSLEVLTAAVEAGTRKLQAAWTPELLQDLNAYHNINVEAELISALSSEIADEIVRELLGKINTLATTNDIIEVKPEDRVPQDPLSALLIQLIRASNDIGRTTRRGMGNVIITSPVGVSILQTMKYPMFKFREGDGASFSAMMHVGDLVDKAGHVQFKVLCTLCLPPSEEKNETFIVGYKGNSEVDAGIMYHPYIPVTPGKLVVNPTTFQPVIALMTRYGIRGRTEGLTKSSNYFRIVKFPTEQLFPWEKKEVELDAAMFYAPYIPLKD